MGKENFSYNNVHFNIDNPFSIKVPGNDNISEIMKKSVLNVGLEQQNSIANSNKGLRTLKKERKGKNHDYYWDSWKDLYTLLAKEEIEREKSRGPQWFNLPSTSLTPEVENDLKIIQMRSVLDSKHFYKKNDLKVLPKYFEVGKVLDSPVDYYQNRIPKKERKNTIVEELLADAEFQMKSKKKYKEIMAQRSKTHYKAHRNAKKLKKNKKR